MTGKFIILITVVFLTFHAAAQNGEGSRCEPSLIYPEVFLLESGECFSYLEANSKYGDKDRLIAYLDSAGGGTHQNMYRYLFYLREKEYLPALMTLMFMVNTGSVPASFESISAEFDNIITGAIKKEKEGGGGMTPFQSGNSGAQITSVQLSDNFFSALSFIASYSGAQNRKESDEMMLNRAFLYIISNIQTGIDWQGDEYLNSLFNKFIQMKNSGVLGSFTRMFFHYLRGYGPVPSFRDYIKMREIGAVKEFTVQDDAAVKEKSFLITEFFIENIDSMPAIEYASDRKKDGSKDWKCVYLTERGAWIDSLADKDPKEYYFNESVKIAEQCPGAFSLPFEVKNGKITVYDRSYWITDIAIVVSLILNGRLNLSDSRSVLDAAVTSSMQKTADIPKTLVMDILSYTDSTGSSVDLILSMFAGELPENSPEGSPEPVTKAAEIISDILF